MPLSPGIKPTVSEDESFSISEEEIKKDAELDKKFNRGTHTPQNVKP